MNDCDSGSRIRLLIYDLSCNDSLIRLNRFDLYIFLIRFIIKLCLILLISDIFDKLLHPQLNKASHCHTLCCCSH
jgi:hypothetical protein